MDLINQFGLVYNLPSRRSEIDYNKSISPEVIREVISLFYQLPGHRKTSRWFLEVSRNFMSLHPDFNAYRRLFLDNHNYTPLSIFEEFLLLPPTQPVVFLDFLETAFKSNRAERDNNLIESINSVLEINECAYRLTKFVKHKVLAESYPKVHLVPDSAIESYSIKPLRELFSDPDFAGPEKYFHNTLERYKLGDYPGCVTSCAAAIEGSVKVIAEKRKINITGQRVGKLSESFISESNSLPNKLRAVVGYFSERRQNIGDAHGDLQPAKTTDAEIHFLSHLLLLSLYTWPLNYIVRNSANQA